MRQQGTVESCSPTRDGRWLIVIKVGKNRVSGYSDTPSIVGGTAAIDGGVVL